MHIVDALRSMSYQELRTAWSSVSSSTGRTPPENAPVIRVGLGFRALIVVIVVGQRASSVDMMPSPFITYRLASTRWCRLRPSLVASFAPVR